MISHLLSPDAAVTTLFLSARERAMLQKEKLRQLASGERQQPTTRFSIDNPRQGVQHETVADVPEPSGSGG